MNSSLLNKTFLSVKEQLNERGILFFNFSKDLKEILVGMENGYKRILLEPYGAKRKVRQIGGGIGIISLLKTKHGEGFCLVGGGRKPAFLGLDSIQVYEDNKNSAVLDCPSKILRILIVENFIVAIMEEEINIFNSKKKFKLIYQTKKRKNEMGICAVSIKQKKEEKKLYLAFPGQKTGEIEIHILEIGSKSSKEEEEKTEKSKKKKKKIIKAHESPIVNLCFNFSTTEIASSSHRSTLIRVFSLENENFGKKRIELRRGSSKSRIYSICYSPDNQLIACTTTHTLHIFEVNESKEGWSFFSGKRADAKLNLGKYSHPSILKFLDNDNLGFLDVNGNFVKIKISGKNGKLVLEIDEEHKFL